MGMIKPERARSGIYFSCGGAACLGLVFWAMIACCMLLMVVSLSTELDSGDADLVSTYHALSQILIGSLAFCFSMGVIIVIFGGFGLYRLTRGFTVIAEAYDLNTVLLYFFLFVSAMLLSAALPTLALEYTGLHEWIKAGGVLLGGIHLLYGMLMLWLTLTAYESYRHADESELR